MRIQHFLFLLIFASACNQKPIYVSKITAKTIAVDSLEKASTFTDVIEPYKEKLTKEMEQVLSFTPKDLSKSDGVLQSSLGNLMADLSVEMVNELYKEETGEAIDFAMLNSGGIRASIAKGDIIIEDAFNVMPFENMYVVATLSGDKVLELVNYFIKNKKAHPLSENVSLTIDNNDFKLLINGKEFDKNQSYNVLTSDYLQNGGDSMYFFANPEKLTKLDYKIRDAIIDYFKKTDTIKAVTDNRIIIN